MISWTEQEDELLKAYWAGDKPIKEWVHLLNNRTCRGVERRAMRLGLPFRHQSAAWTQEEHDRLKEACKSGKPVSAFVDLFPGRTIDGIYSRMKKWGLSTSNEGRPSSHRLTQIEDMLRISPLLTNEIADRMGTSIKNARTFLRQLHQEKRIYIKERVLLSPTARTFIWALGNEPDAPRATMKPATPKKKAEKPMKSTPNKEKIVIKSSVRVFRDPWQEAFFGKAVALPAKPVEGRVIRQSMEVTDDEMEVA